MSGAGFQKDHREKIELVRACADMPHGTDRPYPIRILAFFEMIRPYHAGIRISGNLRGNNCKACVAKRKFCHRHDYIFPG